MIFYSRSVNNKIENEFPVLIETSVSEKGLPVFEIFGLISKSIEESKKRIITAFESLNIEFPLKNIKINLSPAEILKEGTHFDLAIAASILAYTNSLEILESDLFIGELSLDGSVRPVSNISYLVLLSIQLGFRRIFVPKENLHELTYNGNVKIIGISKLDDLITCNYKEFTGNGFVQDSEKGFENLIFPKILGNSYEKKVLSYALAGSHNLMIEGFPGLGKSMLAKSSQELLPDLEEDYQFEVQKLYSYLNISRKAHELNRRPFRNPHTSSSYSAILGTSGTKIYPGEVALANHGVLFLDEFPEYNRQVIEGLRSPLEDKVLSISRAKGKIEFPCDFILIATSNPCKCGYFNHPKIACKCSPIEVIKYKNRVSGPIKDRIDVHLNFTSNNLSKSLTEERNYSYTEFLNLKRAIADVYFRLKTTKNVVNSTQYSPFKNDKNIVHQFLSDEVISLSNNVQEKYSISNRKVLKILNLSLTICIFKNREKILAEDFIEALNLSNVKI